MAERRCDRCGIRMPSYRPRFTEEDGDQVCEGCHNGRPGRPLTGAVQVSQPTTASAPFIRVQGQIVKIAHQSGDNVTVYHCPFCGSGQVVAGSDGTISCDFCDTTFIVQVQPERSSMPQTIDGVPQQLPGMPPPGADPGAKETPPPEDENKSFGGDDLSDKAHDPKDAPDDGSKPNPFGKKDDSSGGDDKPKPDDDKDKKPNPFAKGAFITEAGIALPYDEYVAHLAIKSSQNPEETLHEVRHQHGVE